MHQRFTRSLEEIVDALFLRAIDLDVDIDEWAERAGIHRKTIERIALRKTRFPYWQTIQALALAVDSTLVVEVSYIASKERGAE